MITKKTGFAAPYRSLTFRDIVDAIISRNGVMSMSGEVSESLGIITVPPYAFNQKGLIVVSDAPKTITKPGGLNGSYVLVVHAPTPFQVDDLIYSFVESPLDIDDNVVPIAQWDSNEWRQLPFISIDELLIGIQQDRLDFSFDGPVSGLITAVDGGSYRNTAGVVIDRQGLKVKMDEDALFTIIPNDTEATWKRVDRVVYRRPADDSDRVGQRELLLGGTYSSGSQLVTGPVFLNSSTVHSRVKTGLFGNEAVVVSAQGFGNEFALYFGRVAANRGSLSLSPAAITGITASTDEFDISVDASTGHCRIVYVVNGDIFFIHTNQSGTIVDGPVQLSTQTDPCSNPKIVIDRSGKYLVTYLCLLAPSNNQVFFTSCDSAGNTITGPKKITNTVTNLINQDMVVTPDFQLYVAYEDNSLGKVFYDITNDIGDVLTVAPVYVSASVVSNSFGTNSDAASSPKIRVTETRDIFVFFLQNISGSKKLAIVKNSDQGYSPDVTGPSENFVTYDVVVSNWMNDILVFTGSATQSARGIIKGESAISQASVITSLVVGSGASSASLMQDQTGSLFMVQTNVAPGTFTNSGTPEAVQVIGPAVVIGTQGTVSLASNQMALLTGSLSQTPKVGQRSTIAGATDVLNNGAKIVTAVAIADFNSIGDYTVITFATSFNSSASPAVATTAQFANPNGMSVPTYKTTAETASRAQRKNVLPTDVLLARIIVPGPTILNYVPNPIFSGGTAALAQQFGVYGTSQVDWEATAVGQFTIAATFGIMDLFNALDYVVGAGSFPMAEGDAIYVKLDGTNLSVTPVVTPVATLPFADPIQVLGFIRGGAFNPVLLVEGVGEQLESGEKIVIGQEMSNQTFSALGLLNDVDEGQMRVMAVGSSKRIRITPTNKLVLDGTVWGNEIGNLPMKFTGFQIDLQTGNYYSYDGLTLIGSAFTPGAFTSPNLFRWYSINLVADTIASDGAMQVKPLVMAGSPDGTSSVNAIKATYSSKKLGQVLVQAPGTGSAINNIVQTNIVQLPAGTGSGGSSAPKMLGGGNFSNVTTESAAATLSQLTGSAAKTITTSANQFAGQTFSVAADHFLKDVTLKLLTSGTPTGRVRAEVYEIASLSPGGAFSGELLGASENFDTAAVTATPTDFILPFSSPIFTRSGKFYAVILKSIEALGAAIDVRATSSSVVAGNAVTGNTGSTITTDAASDLYYILNFVDYSMSISYEEQIAIEQPRLSYTDNIVPVSQGPWVLPTPAHVAYINRLNASSGGSNLTVLIDLITNVKDGQVILARRQADAVIIGSSSTRLRSNQSARLFSSFSNFTNQDRNFKLVEGGTWSVANSGGQKSLRWSGDAYLDIPGVTRLSNIIPAKPAGLILRDGDVAYVTASRVSKITQPTWVQRASQSYVNDNVGAFAAGDGYVFVPDATSNTIRVFDVSNPQAPSLVATFSVPTGTIHAVENSMVYDPATKHLYAFVNTGGANEKIAVYDAMNPLAMVQVGLSSAFASGGAANPGNILISENGQYLYTTRDQLRVWNISPPSGISSPVGSISHGGTQQLSRPTLFGGSYMLAVNGSGGFYVVDLSVPATPTTIGSVTTLGLTAGANGGGGIVVGNYIILGAINLSTQLKVIDISTPAAAVVAATFSTSLGASDVSLYRDTRAGFTNLVYAVSSANSGITLQILDVTNPLLITSVATQSIPVRLGNGGTLGGYFFSGDGTDDKFYSYEMQLVEVLPVSVQPINQVNPNRDDLCIIARRINNTVYVGSKSMALLAGQFATLDGAIQEVYRRISQLSLQPHPTNPNRLVLTGVDISMLDQSLLSFTMKQKLVSFSGAQIDFSTGSVFKDDGVTALGVNFTPFAVPNGEYFYYSVTLASNTVNANNTQSVQLNVLPATASNPTFGSAPRPPFPAGGAPIGAVWVQGAVSGIQPLSFKNINMCPAIIEASSSTSGNIFNNNSAGGLTVLAATTLFNPFLKIVLGDTYTVAAGAQLVSVSSLIVNGTLVNNGTVRVL